MKDITYDPTKGKWKTRDGWYFNTTKKARDHLKKSKKEVKETNKYIEEIGAEKFLNLIRN